jgi:hypothetical protein
MQTTATAANHGTGGNVVAFVFGAIFNLVANGGENILTYTIKVLIYVLIYFSLKLITDIHVKRYFDDLSDRRRRKSKRILRRKRDHDAEG